MSHEIDTKGHHPPMQGRWRRHPRQAGDTLQEEDARDERDTLQEMQGTHFRRAVLHAAVLLIPLILWMWVVPRAGRVQYNDYWGVLASVVDQGGFTTDPVRWLTVKSNEHTVAVPALLYAANVRLTHGDNRALSAWAVLCMMVTATLAWRLVPVGVREAPGTGTALAALTGTLAMTPVAAHNVVYGFSGAMWLSANALSIAAISLAWQGVRKGSVPWRPGIGWVVAASAVGLAASLTYSTGLAVWPALAVVLLAAGAPGRWFLIPALPALADLAFEMATYVRPPSIPPPETGNLPLLAGYVAVYIGHVLCRPLWLAAAVGGGGLVAAAAFVLRPLGGAERGRRFLAPWYGIGCFALVNAVVTAVGRASLGGARSSRYATLAGLFWLALVVVWLTVRRERTRRAAWPVAVIAVLVAATWVRGAREVRLYLEQAAEQPLGALAWTAGIRDDDALRTICLVPDQLWRVRPLAIRLRHVPFDGPSLPAPGTLPELQGTLPKSHAPGTGDGPLVRAAETPVAHTLTVSRTVGDILVLASERWRDLSGGRPALLLDGSGAVVGAVVGLGRLPWLPDRVKGYALPAARGERRLAVAVSEGDVWRVVGSAVVSGGGGRSDGPADRNACGGAPVPPSDPAV